MNYEYLFLSGQTLLGLLSWIQAGKRDNFLWWPSDSQALPGGGGGVSPGSRFYSHVCCLGDVLLIEGPEERKLACVVGPEGFLMSCWRIDSERTDGWLPVWSLLGGGVCAAECYGEWSITAASWHCKKFWLPIRYGTCDLLHREPGFCLAVLKGPTTYFNRSEVWSYIFACFGTSCAQILSSEFIMLNKLLKIFLNILAPPNFPYTPKKLKILPLEFKC